MDLKENAREHLLEQALKDIEQTGIYWNGSISRKQRRCLIELLHEHGYDIHMNELPPHWEHVFYTSKFSYDKVLKLAKERARNSDF